MKSGANNLLIAYPVHAWAMARVICAVILSLVALNVFAAPDSFASANELLEAGAPRISPEEMRALIEPESNIDLISPTNGHLLHFHNRSDGTLSVVSLSADRLWVYFGKGTWKLDDQGRYCIDMAWSGSSDKRCRVAYRHHNALYLGGIDLKRNLSARIGLFAKAEKIVPGPVSVATFNGSWKAIFFPETTTPLGAEVHISEQGGTWRTYSLALMKYDPCVGQLMPLKIQSRSEVEITLEVASSDLVAYCTNSRMRLIWLDENTLAGQSDTGWALRLVRQ